MKEKITKAGVFTLGLGAVLVPSFLALTLVQKQVKNQRTSNNLTNLLLLGGMIGGIYAGYTLVKKYEQKQLKKK